MGILSQFMEGEQKETFYQDIVRNLNDLLNTKLGFGAWQKTLGISDASSYGNRKDLLKGLLQEIHSNIEHHEPRVDLEEIRELDTHNTFHLRFEMVCRIIDRPEKLLITFDTKGNHVHVQL